jgi:thymidylate synthase
MNISSITARDLPEAWFLCLRKTLGEGREYVIDRGSNVGHSRRELDFIVLKVEHPGNRPLVPDVPQGVPAPTCMDYIENYVQYLVTSMKADNEQYTYGEDIEPQIPEIIRMYTEQGHNTNQGFISIGSRESIGLTDPPCLRGIDTRVLDERLHFIVYFRSWDLWAGFPSNLAGLQLLKEYIASEIGVEDGELIALSKGLHLYDYSWDLARVAARL